MNGVAGSDLSYSDSVVPELDITYFFTKNIAAELILGVTPHNIYAPARWAASTWQGVAAAPDPDPPVPLHRFRPLKPYVGAGVN